MYLPVEDGITHINIYSKSSTILGQQLSNFYRSKFEIHGKTFNSVEGFYYWLLTKKQYNEMTLLYGIDAKKVGQYFASLGDLEEVDEIFKNEICQAIKQKVLHNPDIIRNIIKSELPFAHYYYFGKIENPKIVELPEHQYMVDYYEKIRKHLKENK